jgi:hypothetical protein
MMRSWLALGCLLCLAIASPALAHHVSGNVYCDQDGDGMVDVPGDIPLSGISVLATSLDASPGEQFSDTTDGSGAFFVSLPARTDRYQVELTSLPMGFTVVVPPGGSYVVQIITGSSSQDHVDGLIFLVQGCGPTTTTSTTSTSTTTSTTSTTSSTTTTTTTTTTPTTLAACGCSNAFLVRRNGRFNNEATIGAGVAANDLGGRIKFGRRVTLADGTTVTADKVQAGPGTSIDDVLANSLRLGPEAVVRGSTGTPTLPVLSPFCSVPAVTCGSNDVQVPPGGSAGPLAPGTYGRLRVLDGGSITLQPGEFTFCSIRTGRNAEITTLGPATLRVSREVIIGTEAVLGPALGTDPVVVEATGRTVRVSAGAMANANFIAPNARITFGRGARLLGCFCTDRAKTDKRITLECPGS